ncbi:MAG: hypothetical protein K9N47_03655 [Prosthecobacter sp.]|uniref:hypothetical protein n=1 Tax=Prosthecobacter sp. TaxID=1965333 RepID=UPI0025E2BBB6|nr:hypothetical protein [Prosthecobacter sp.]MCF7785190.1 hypothetical protein [Prosthecobacter sp.]
MKRFHTALRHLSVLAAALVLSNCATHTPNAVYISPLTAVISQGDGVSTRVSTTDSRMSEEERQMLGDRITQAVQTLAQPGSGAANQYELEVNITRYTKGSGFVRTAMPGMGQMHLDGVVTVYQMPKRVPVGQFMINKAFAIGGLYSLAVNMNTIANTYAQAVAKTVCQVR